MGIYKNYDEGKAANLFLDFHAELETETGKKVVSYARKEDQDAYDTWHLAWYFNEILEIFRLEQLPNLTMKDLPRKEKHLLVYLCLAALDRPAHVMELGCSLFEMIDGLRLVHKLLKGKSTLTEPDILSRTQYSGVDLSDVMRRGALRLHPEAKIQLYESLSELNQEFDLLYDRNVSSYFCSSCDDLLHLLTFGKTGLLNLYFCRDETFISMRMGKCLTYFHLGEMIERLEKPLYHLYGMHSPGTSRANFEAAQNQKVVEGFFLYGDEDFAHRFMDVARQFPEVNSWFEEKEIKLTPVRELW